MVFTRKLKTKTGTYLVKVETIRKDRKVRQKHLGMIGKVVDGKEILYGQIQDSEITNVSVAGNVLVLKDLMKQLELEKLLDAHTENQGKWIAALVLAHCTNPSSINKMKRWCKRHDVTSLLGMNPDECEKDRFYRALDKLDEKSIIQIEKALHKRLKVYMKRNGCLFYDITSTYFYGTKCSIAKSGYNAENLGEPQIHIGLAVAKSHGFPIFHQVYEGNIQDVRSIEQALNTLKDFGVKKTTLVWDRGMSSKGTFIKAKSCGFNVIAGLPLKGYLKEKAIRMREGIATISNRVRLSTQIIYAKDFLLEVYGKKGKLVICSNEKEREVLKELRYDEIENAVRRWKKGLKIKDKVKKYVLRGKVNEDMVARAELADGLYALFSTDTSLNAKDIVKTYFEKDMIEKAFKCLKGMIKIRPVRHWLSERVKAHVFICYLSYALFSLLKWKLESSKLEMSVENALNLLEDLHRVRIYDPRTGNSFVKHTVMSKQQEAVFKAVNKDLIGSVV